LIFISDKLQVRSTFQFTWVRRRSPETGSSSNNKATNDLGRENVGYVHRRTDAAGEIRYTAMYRDINDRRTSAGTFTTPEEARDAWRDAEAALSAGRVGDPRRGRQKFRHYVETTWFPDHVMEERTRENYRYVLDRYLLPEFGDMQMVAILPGHVRSW
jgi:hypothetical protein